MRKKEHIKLALTATLGEGDALAPEHFALAARLLRSAADRIEQQKHDLGGFHFGPEDSHDGGFALYPSTKDTR